MAIEYYTIRTPKGSIYLKYEKGKICPLIPLNDPDLTSETEFYRVYQLTSKGLNSEKRRVLRERNLKEKIEDYDH